MTDQKTQTKTLTLAFPIDGEGGLISRVTLRRPKVKDLRKIEGLIGEDGTPNNDDMDAGLAMIAALSDLPEGGVDELDLEDFTILSEALSDFFPKKAISATGESSSPKPPTG